MDHEQCVRSEAEVKRLHEAQNLPAATKMALELYGRDVVRLLLRRLRSRSDVEDAFSQFTEDLWRGFASFNWRCALRTWLVTLARHAAARLLGAAHRRREIHVPDEYVATFPAEPSVPPALYLRSDVQARMRELRNLLSDDQQQILALRVDQALSWRDLAFMVEGVAASADDRALEHAEARLRARFGTVKKRLRALARQDGLLS